MKRVWIMTAVMLTVVGLWTVAAPSDASAAAARQYKFSTKSWGCF